MIILKVKRDIVYWKKNELKSKKKNERWIKNKKKKNK